MANQTGIFITIKGWLPTGKNLDEQFEALSLVKQAHASGDYAPLLAAAKIEAVQTEQKTRRMDDTPAPTTQPPADNEHVADGASPFPEPTPAAADPAVSQVPVMDQADGTDERPVAEPALIEEPKRKSRAAANA